MSVIRLCGCQIICFVSQQLNSSTLCMTGNFAYFFSFDFFQNQLFHINLSRTPSDCQTVILQISRTAKARKAQSKTYVRCNKFCKGRQFNIPLQNVLFPLVKWFRD